MTAREFERRQDTAPDRVTIRMPSDMYKAVRTVAFVTGESINDLVVKAVGDYLSTEGRRLAVEGHLQRAQEEWRVALDKLA